MTDEWRIAAEPQEKQKNFADRKGTLYVHPHRAARRAFLMWLVNCYEMSHMIWWRAVSNPTQNVTANNQPQHECALSLIERTAHVYGPVHSLRSELFHWETCHIGITWVCMCARSCVPMCMHANPSTPKFLSGILSVCRWIWMNQKKRGR